MAYHHGDLKRAALEAAHDWILEHPHEDLSVRELATSLSVTPRAIYRHFEDRVGLLTAVAQHSFSLLSDAITPAITRATPGHARRVLLEHYLDFALESATRYRVMYGMGEGSLNAKGILRDGVVRLIALAEQAVLTDVEGMGARARRDHIMMLVASCHGHLELYFGGTLRATSDARARNYILRQMEPLIGAEATE